MKKFLYITVIVCSIVSAASIFYYFVIFLPSKEPELIDKAEVVPEVPIQAPTNMNDVASTAKNTVHDESELEERQRECADLGRLYLENEEDKYEEASGAILPPTYHYSERFKTCFYSGGIVWYDENYSVTNSHQFLIDLHTNETTLSYYGIDEKKLEEYKLYLSWYLND